MSQGRETAPASESRRFHRRLLDVFGGHGLYDTREDPFADQRDHVERPILHLFTDFGRPHWDALGVGLGAGFLSRFIDLLPPLFLGIAIDAVFLETSVFSLPFVPAAWLPETVLAQFWLSAGLIGGAFLLAAVCNWIRIRGLNAFAQEVQNDLRVETYDQIQRLRMPFFDDRQTGELMSILSSDVNNLDAFLKGGIDRIIQLVVTVGGTGAILFAINWQLAVVTLAVVPVIGVFTYVYIQAVKPRYKRVRESLGELFSRLENNLTGIQVIKTFNTERFERERVAEASRTYRDRNWEAIRLSAIFNPSQQALAGVAFAMVFVIGGFWVFAGPPPGFSGSLSVGQFVTFILLSQRFINPMTQFGETLDLYQRAQVSAARIFGLMADTELSEFDEAGAVTLTDPVGRLAFEDVNFGYGETPILKGISFSTPADTTTALVGPSGSGKSTVLKLLPRLYDVDSGSVTLDGTPVDQLTRDSLRQSIGYVGQDPFMFFGSVRENIAYGREDVTDEDIEAAARAAHAHRFIQNLPDGYETAVGQRGGKLSGGQRQRLSIARAILRDPEILILDEATSAVDTETELLIQKALERITEGRTTFAIAHRLSTIRTADQILVFEDGEIVERGTHDDLLAADGLYAHLWQVQAGLLDELPASFIERAAARAARIQEETA